MNFIQLILSILSLVIIYKIISALHHFYVLRRHYKNIPGSTVLPFVDTLSLFIRMSPAERTVWYQSLPYQFKDGIFISWVGFMPVVHIFKPEYLEAIVCSPMNIERAIFPHMTKLCLEDGLFNSTGTQWFHDRKLIAPAFNYNILKDFTTIMFEKAEILTKRLEEEIEKRQGRAIDIFPFAVNTVLDIICETAMGLDMCDRKLKDAYHATMERAMSLLMERIYRPWQWPDWIYFLTPAGKEAKTIMRNMRNITNEIVTKKKVARQLKNGNTKPANKKIESDIGRRRKKGFLDLLLDENERDDAPLTDDQLKIQVDTFLITGYDTASAAITWTLLCLGSNLEHQEKVHEELEQVFKDSQSPPSMEKLSQLRYLDRVVKETLRLMPSVAIIPRILGEDLKFDNYHILKGTIVLLDIALLHRNEKIWPEPLKFDPDRFLPENLKDRHAYAYAPFSAGVRNCIGQKYALLELKVVVSTVLRKWRVKSLKTHDNVEYAYNITTRPCEEILIEFMPKK